MTPSNNLMDKLFSFPSAIHQSGIGYTGDDNAVMLANQQSPYWFLCAKGGSQSMIGIFKCQQEELEKHLSEEEKNELLEALENPPT